MAGAWLLLTDTLKYLAVSLLVSCLCRTGKARRGREKSIRLLNRRREGKDHNVSEDSRTGTGRGEHVYVRSCSSSTGLCNSATAA